MAWGSHCRGECLLCRAPRELINCLINDCLVVISSLVWRKHREGDRDCGLTPGASLQPQGCPGSPHSWWHLGHLMGSVLPRRILPAGGFSPFSLFLSFSLSFYFSCLFPAAPFSWGRFQWFLFQYWFTVCKMSLSLSLENGVSQVERRDLSHFWAQFCQDLFLMSKASSMPQSQCRILKFRGMFTREALMQEEQQI